VMGAYGQVPWREFLFGGATREVVGSRQHRHTRAKGTSQAGRGELITRQTAGAGS
jgi:hypothetical protein